MKRLIIKIILIIVIVLIAAYTLKTWRTIDQTPIKLTEARIKPVGKVNVASSENPAATAPAAATASGDIGKKIYETKCVVCHGSGLAGAPKFGDAAAWQPRIAKGMPTLFSHAKNGFNAMPPKGTCTECSDSDLQAAITYMTKKNT